MGADLILCAVELPEHCDWAAGERYLADLQPDMVVGAYERELLFVEPDPGAGDLAGVREQLRADLDELRRIADGAYPRDCVNLEVRGATVLVAGGTSWGDSPSETFDAFCRLQACGVLAVLAASS